MGLDMYFYRGKKCVGYFRKANAIHNYIVENFAGGVDECQKIVLGEEELKQISSDLKKVLTAKDREKMATELFPTAQGFFFGSLEYDDYYFESLFELAKILRGNSYSFSSYKGSNERVTKMVYQASW